MSGKKLAAVTVAAISAVAVWIPSAANADPTDVGGAMLSEAQDIAAAMTNNVVQVTTDPNTTCQVKAVGDNAAQRTNFLVGEVFTEDLGTATGECASFDTSSYSATVTMNLQAYFPTSATTGNWVTFCSAATAANSIEGAVQPLPATKLCQITAPSAYLNRYHRVQGVITNTRGQRFVDYSPIWFDTP